MDNWNLSDKMHEECFKCVDPFLHIEDVREFIKRLKEFMQGNSEEEPVIIGMYGIRRYPIREIDKLAGDKLI